MKVFDMDGRDFLHCLGQRNKSLKLLQNVIFDQSIDLLNVFDALVKQVVHLDVIHGVLVEVVVIVPSVGVFGHLLLDLNNYRLLGHF